MDTRNLVWGFFVAIALLAALPFVHIITDAFHEAAGLLDPGATKHVLVDTSAPATYPTISDHFITLITLYVKEG
jgi:hypothetical protein